MKRFSWETKDSYTVEEVVNFHIDGRDYGQGVLEDVKDTVNNIEGFLGKLCQRMVDRGVLTENDISAVLGMRETNK